MSENLHHPEFHNLKEAIKYFSLRNWIPATSSNFSVRTGDEQNVWITRSGVDKNLFTLKDLMEVDLSGRPVNSSTHPSAETLIHCTLYDMYPETVSVLHIHGIFSTVLSLELEAEGEIRLSNYELLKGFPGVDSHTETVAIPIYSNTQDMKELANELKSTLKEKQPRGAFLLAGHGLYTWGKSVTEAKRITESVEHLLECLYYRGNLRR